MRHAAVALMFFFAFAGCEREQLLEMRRQMRVHEHDCQLAHDVYYEARAAGRTDMALRALQIAEELGCPIL